MEGKVTLQAGSTQPSTVTAANQSPGPPPSYDVSQHATASYQAPQPMLEQKCGLTSNVTVSYSSY